jgi:hypothetical protein
MLNKKGVGLILAVMVLFVMGIVTAAIFILTRSDLENTARDQTKMTFFNAADAGCEYMYAYISSNTPISSTVDSTGIGANKWFKIINIVKKQDYAAGYSIDLGGTTKSFIFLTYSFTSIGGYNGRTDTIDAKVTYGPIPSGTGY